MQSFCGGRTLSPAEKDQLAQKEEDWPQRLMDISCFMPA